MKIFVAFHFDDEVERPPGELSNRDLAGFVKELIESHGMTPVSGEHVGGGQLENEIKQEIEASDGLIALCTADQKLAEGGARATQWVENELGKAKEGKPCIAVIEETVVNNGMYEGHEHAPLERSEPVPTLIKLSHTLTRWKTSTATFEVLPADIAEMAADPEMDLECYYQLWSKGKPGEWIPIQLVPEENGTYATVNVTSPEDGVRFKVKYDNKLWASRVTPQRTQVVFKPYRKK